LDIIAYSVDTVGAIIHAVIGKKDFKREIHLPSSDQLWHIPKDAAFPRPPLVFFLLLPLEEHETSYFAAADNISSFFEAPLKCTSRKLLNKFYHKGKNKANICSGYYMQIRPDLLKIG